MLEAIHKRGFLHRDIKPSNTMVDGRSMDKLWLIDFGIARTYLNKDGSHIKLKTGDSKMH